LSVGAYLSKEYPEAYRDKIFFLFSMFSADQMITPSHPLPSKFWTNKLRLGILLYCLPYRPTFLFVIHITHRSYGRVGLTVLGKQPALTKSLSMIPVNGEKILIVEKGVPLIDSFWFLEVNTSLLCHMSFCGESYLVFLSRGRNEFTHLIKLNMRNKQT
jgi:hypothetical protein